jgi:uncharacterized membrane protein
VFTCMVEISVSRPLDEVFAYVGDVRNRPRWDESVDSEELTSPEPIGDGTTVRTRLRSMGREYQYTWKIVVHEPPNRMRVESTSGPFPTTLDFQFFGRDGETEVQATVTGRPTGLMRLMQPMISRTTQKNLDRGYARLKRLLETATSTQDQMTSSTQDQRLDRATSPPTS